MTWIEDIVVYLWVHSILGNEMYADQYNDKSLNVMLKDLLELIEKHKPKTCNKILDFGCGSGIISSKILKNYNGLYYGVDPEVKIFEKRFENNEKVLCEKADIDSSLIKENEFDIVLAIQVFEHLNDFETVLKTLKDRMKKDGVIAITLPYLWEFFFCPRDAIINRGLTNYKFYGKLSVVNRLIFKEVKESPKLMPRSIAKLIKNKLRNYSIEEYVSAHIANKIEDDAHKHWFNKKILVSLLERNGFEVINFKYHHFRMYMTIVGRKVGE